MKSNVVHTPKLVYNRKYAEVVRVQAVEILEAFHVRITFSDGVVKDVDLEPHIQGPIFEPVRTNPESFRAMYVDSGTIVWNDEMDIDPNNLYYGNETPPWMVEYEKRHKRAQARKTSKRKTVRSRNTPKKRTPTGHPNSPGKARPAKTAKSKPKVGAPKTTASKK